jgi:hypothetical protein
LPRADIAVLTLLGAPFLLVLPSYGMSLRERVQGIAFVDPALGGDPDWRARPMLVPLVVAAAIVGRLFLARRRWPMSPSRRRAYAILLTLPWAPSPLRSSPRRRCFRGEDVSTAERRDGGDARRLGQIRM